MVSIVRNWTAPLPLSLAGSPSSSPGSWEPGREQENMPAGVVRSSWGHGEGRGFAAVGNSIH